MYKKIFNIKRILSKIRSIESLQYASIDSPAVFFERKHKKFNKETAVDLGCGNAPQNPMNCKKVIGIDIHNPQHREDIVTRDLFFEHLPFESGSVDVVTAHDFIEHIPRYNQGKNGETRFPFVLIMDEVFRVLRPGGYFYSRTPAFPKPQVFQDPTHVNILTEETFPKYFCSHQWGGLVNKPWGSYYEFKGDFELVDQKWCHHWLLTLLHKPEI